MARKYLVPVLALALTVPAVAAPASPGELPPGGSFMDDDGDAHEGDIEAIAARDITRGCNPDWNDRFCAHDPVTRGQMAAFLARALELSAGGSDPFADDDGSVFETDIAALARAGITRGCNPPDNDRFCPDLPLTRGQMAAFLVRAFGFDGGDDLFGDDDGSIFESDIDALGAAGVTRGCDPPNNQRFCPDEPVTRGQMASFLTRALGLDPLSPPQRQVVFTVDAGIDVEWNARTGEDEPGAYYERHRLWDRSLGCDPDGDKRPCTIDITSDNAEVWVEGPDGRVAEMSSRLHYYPIRFIPPTQAGVYEFTFRLDDGTVHRAMAEIREPRSVPLVPTGATREGEDGSLLGEFRLGDLDLRQATSAFYHPHYGAPYLGLNTERNFWVDLDGLLPGPHTFAARVDGRWYYAVVEHPDEFS